MDNLYIDLNKKQTIELLKSDLYNSNLDFDELDIDFDFDFSSEEEFLSFVESSKVYLNDIFYVIMKDKNYNFIGISIYPDLYDFACNIAKIKNKFMKIGSYIIINNNAYHYNNLEIVKEPLTLKDELTGKVISFNRK